MCVCGACAVLFFHLNTVKLRHIFVHSFHFSEGKCQHVHVFFFLTVRVLVCVHVHIIF